MGTGISILAVIFLLALSAFFSISETAMTAASRARLTSWEKEGNKLAALVNRLRERKDRVIGTLLLGNNLINILASALATSVLIRLFGDAGVFYATAVMTILVLIFAEVLPKTYALQHPDKVAVVLAPAVQLFVWMFAPLVGLTGWIVQWALRLFGAEASAAAAGGHIEALRGMIELHRGPEEEVRQQRAMLRSVLDLADVDVGQIMLHRKNVTMIDASGPVTKIIEDVLRSPYTRLPVYRENPDNITGILHVKSLLRQLQEQEGRVGSIDIETLASEPWFIPESTTLFDQLQAFRARCEHFAVVVDEYGTFMGIVTLEDILEEIVGEIDDELDVTVTGVRKQSGGAYLVDGKVTIRDLNRAFEWNLPDDKDFATVAGLVIHEAKTIPEVGLNFTFYGFRFDIMRRVRNQITLIRVTPPEKRIHAEAA